MKVIKDDGIRKMFDFISIHSLKFFPAMSCDQHPNSKFNSSKSSFNFYLDLDLMLTSNL